MKKGVLDIGINYLGFLLLALVVLFILAVIFLGGFGHGGILDRAASAFTGLWASITQNIQTWVAGITNPMGGVVG